MRVNPNSNPVNTRDARAVPSRTPARELPADREQVVLSGTETVKRALEQTSAVRPEKVARAKALLQEPNYPPDNLLTQIASVLAGQMITPN